VSSLGSQADALGLRLAKAEARFHDLARTTVGLRIVDRVGWTRMLRFLVAAVWVMSVLQVILVLRPDLLFPADIGTDSSNYVAAAERLAAGHPIYALQAGDRPVPLDNPPEWNVPILSPPTTATTYLWAVPLPGAAGFYVNWGLGLVATVAVGLLAIAVAPPLFLLLMFQVIPVLAITAWSGNINALIAGALVLTFWGGRSSARGPQLLAGIAIGVVAAAKIGPLVACWWLLLQGRRTASMATIVTGLLVAAVTVLLAGLSTFSDYLAVVRDAASVPTVESIPGTLTNLGLPAAVAALGLPIALVVLGVLMVPLRNQPWSFLLAVFGTAFATTIVRKESAALLVVASIAWAGRGLLVPRLPLDRNPESPLHALSRPARLTAVAGVAAAAIAIAISIRNGGADVSRFSISNSSTEPLIARLGVRGQNATFGYALPGGASITGWAPLSGGSAPILTIWSPACDLRTGHVLDREGGLAETSGEEVTMQAARPTAVPADYVPTCATEAKEVRLGQ
jgi:hypothetical protein